MILNSSFEEKNMSKSVIYLTDVVENKNPHRLAKPDYVLVYVVDAAGITVPALLTDKEIERGVARAEKNPEDVCGKTFKECWVTKLARKLGVCE